MQPLISVIVPIYKAELYLRKCVDSILAQTYQNLEIILVDDGSPDGCGAICDEYAKKDSRIRVVHQENGGVSAARNAGLEAASGEYIGFVDPDDWIAPDMYQCLYRGLEEYRADIAVCEYYNCWSRKCSGAHRPSVKIYKGREGMEALLSLEVGNYLWNKLFKRELWTPDIRFPDGKLFEDVRTIYKVVQKCQTMVTIPEAKYYYRRHSSSITRVDRIGNHVECILSRIERFDEIAEDYPGQREFMLKNIFEYAYPLRNAICAQDKAVYETVRADVDIITAFLRRHEREIIEAYGFGRLGRLSLHYMSRGDRKGWLLSAKVDRVFGQKKKATQSKIVALWSIMVERAKKYGKLSYYYKWCMHLPIKKAIFMESRFGEDLAGNLFEIARSACARGLKVYLSVKPGYCEKVQKILSTGEFPGLKVVEKRSWEYYKVLGTSKYWFTDTCLDDDAIKRQGQVFVNTWHGTPLKALEFDIKGQRHAMGGGPRDHLETNYFAVPSRFLFEILLSSSHVEPLFSGKALYCGYPRNSIFFDTAQRQRVRQELGLDDKEVFAFLPTWRDPSEADIYKEYSTKTILDFLESRLKDNQILYVKLHNLSKETIDCSGYKKIRPFPGSVDTYTMLNATDCLITDYSSVYFDYANTGKKVILFAYDHKEYLKDRGLYFGLEDMPFPKVYTFEELASELNTVKAYDDKEFLRRFCTYDCADAAEKLLDVVVDGKPSCESEPVAKDDKKNILIYDARIMSRQLDDSTVRAALDELDTDEANYFYCYRQNVLSKTPAYLRQLPEGVRVFVLTYNISLTLGEKLMAKLRGDGMAKANIKREVARQFGGKTFDEIRILGENEYDPFCAMLKELGSRKESHG